MTNGTKKTTLGQNKNWQTGQKKMSPNLEWWAKGVGLLRGGPRKVGAPKGGGPKPRKVGPEGWGPEGWAPRKVGPRRVGPKGWCPEGWHPRVGHRRVGQRRVGEAQNFALFFPPRHNFLSFFSLLGVLSCNFGGFFEASGRSNVHVWSSRAVVCEPRRPGLVGPPGLHTTVREPKRAHLRVPVFKNTTKIQREDTQEREERMKIVAERDKKARNFGRSGGGAVLRKRAGGAHKSWTKHTQ